MIILGIETSSDACSVAIKKVDSYFTRYEVKPQGHAKLLLQMVDDLCSEAKISLAEVDAFAYGKGPGSFTGLRIAASSIQGLAFAFAKPVIAVSTLNALAAQAFQQTEAKQVLATLDARMQEIYFGVYQQDSQGNIYAKVADTVQLPDTVILDSIDSLGVGTGCLVYQSILQAQNSKLVVDTSIIYPRATEIVDLAASAFIRQDGCLTASQAVPTYIRNNVAN